MDPAGIGLALALAAAPGPVAAEPQVALASVAAGAPGCGCEHAVTWPLWQRYGETFISAEGRVVEPSAGERTTSEGQAYALFFALVANDRARFERLLAWTRDNLAGGDLTRTLPGWQWGKDAHGAWRLLDPSSASDADLWLAYDLLEAGRLWHEPSFTKLGRAVLSRVSTREVARLPRLGTMLLPGPVGFEVKKGTLWRLNPSYLPLPLLRRFATEAGTGPWAELPATTVRLVRETAPQGFAPDWIGFDRTRGFVADPVNGPIAGYDAIRVYLWAGLLPEAETLRPALLSALDGPVRWWREHHVLPEKVDAENGADRGEHAPPGFLAALLPAAVASGDTAWADELRAALADTLHDGLYGSSPTYYDQNLAMFARGFDEGRFRFDAGGALRTEWETTCCVR